MNKVENENGLTLYHIQNMNMCSDGTPFDLFVWSDHFPNEEDLEKAFKNEGFSGDGVGAIHDEFMTSSNIYGVYAEEV